MKFHHKSLILTIPLILASLSSAGELYERSGWVAELPPGSHQVEGLVTIIDERTLHVEHFTYDGGGPAVYFYLGETDSNPSFVNGLELMPLLTGTVFNNESITVTLPPGETLDDYGAISVWCKDFNVSFSSGSFASPVEPAYPRAGWVAEITNGAHDVELLATIINDRIIHVEHFTYDGTAPAVYFYLGSVDSQQAFIDGLELEPQLIRAYVNEDLILTVPDGETLDAYTAISVWCAAFNANFGSEQFKFDDPADANDDGDVDLEDYADFHDCLNGPGVLPDPSVLTEQECLDAFDHDQDNDVDLADYARFQVVFTGPPAETAQYQFVFHSTWSAATHPVTFPSNPHYSGLIGGTHNDTIDFWVPGELASTGIERMAETGSKTSLTSEVNAQINAGNAGQVISGSSLGTSPGSVSVTFTVSQEFPLATITTMIAPSPDWFVGISGQELFVDNQWLTKVVLDAHPWDAGTDSGTEYSSPNQDTNPPEPIHLINGYPFLNGPVQYPLGTFTLTRIN